MDDKTELLESNSSSDDLSESSNSIEVLENSTSFAPNSGHFINFDSQTFTHPSHLFKDADTNGEKLPPENLNKSLNNKEIENDPELEEAIRKSLQDLDTKETPKEDDAFSQELMMAIQNSQKEAIEAKKIENTLRDKKKLREILSSLNPLVNVDDPRFNTIFDD